MLVQQIQNKLNNGIWKNKMNKYKIGDKFIVISSDMNAVKVGDILEYQHDLIDTNLFRASGWTINYDLSMNNFPETKLHLLEETKLKKVNIEVPEGYVIDEENSTFTCIKFKKEEKKENTCWKDLKVIDGFYTDSDSQVHDISDIAPNDELRNVFATKEQAEASIALAMLSQLIKAVNGDWIPDWSDDKVKFIIRPRKNALDSDNFCSYQYFLSFPTKEIRDTFLLNHEELIMKAKPLL